MSRGIFWLAVFWLNFLPSIKITHKILSNKLFKLVGVGKPIFNLRIICRFPTDCSVFFGTPMTKFNIIIQGFQQWREIWRMNVDSGWRRKIFYAKFLGKLETECIYGAFVNFSVQQRAGTGTPASFYWFYRIVLVVKGHLCRKVVHKSIKTIRYAILLECRFYFINRFLIYNV